MYSDVVATARAHCEEKRHRSIRAPPFIATVIGLPHVAEFRTAGYGLRLVALDWAFFPMSGLMGERKPPTMLQVGQLMNGK
jgi:hypothetical protein